MGYRRGSPASANEAGGKRRALGAKRRNGSPSVAWDKLGEIVSQYLTRGRRVYVEGRLQTRQYDDKEGQRRYFTEVVAQDVQFLDGSEAKAQQAESLFEDTNVA